jgi:hypothetical protein
MSIRFADIDSINTQLPINDYIFSELVSLEKAVEPLSRIVDKVNIHAAAAKLATQDILLEDGLTHDEAAAVYLYSMETGPRSVYRLVNTALQANILSRLKSWFLYLKLIHTALNKLPSQQVKLWRGIRKDVSTGYLKGMCVTWFSISSCSNDAGVVEKFLDKKAHSTLFSIDCKNGKSIAKYSASQQEYEIILMPGTRLKVINKSFEYNGLHHVGFEELPNPNALRKYSILPGIKNLESPSSLFPRDRRKYTPGTTSYTVAFLPTTKKSTSSTSSNVEQKKDKCEYINTALVIGMSIYLQ